MAAQEHNYDVPQIYYGVWGAELAPGHEDYWWMVGTIADWLGYALEGAGHARGVGESPYFRSTIAVQQTKEKFGHIRCYCSFAHPAGVKTKYDEKVATLLGRNEDYFKWKGGALDPASREYPHPWTIEDYAERFPLDIPTLEDFVEHRYLEDAKWYRQIYFEAIRLWPQYEYVITAAADCPEYLFKTEEGLDAHLDGVLEQIKKWNNKKDAQRHRDQIGETRKLAKLVSQFKLAKAVRQANEVSEESPK